MCMDRTGTWGSAPAAYSQGKRQSPITMTIPYLDKEIKFFPGEEVLNFNFDKMNTVTSLTTSKRTVHLDSGANVYLAAGNYLTKFD